MDPWCRLARQGLEETFVRNHVKRKRRLIFLVLSSSLVVRCFQSLLFHFTLLSAMSFERVSRVEEQCDGFIFNTYRNMHVRERSQHKYEHYGRIRCAWVRRHQIMASEYWSGEVLRRDRWQFREDEMTSRSDFVTGRCAVFERNNRIDICSNVAHRQKPLINVSISGDSWFSHFVDTGRRDCAASACDVTLAVKRTDDIRIQVGASPNTRTPEKTASDLVDVLVQIQGVTVGPVEGEDIGSITSSERYNFETSDWLPISHSNSDAILYHTVGAKYAARRKRIPILISSCAAHPRRDELIVKLSQYIDLENFGTCPLHGVLSSDVNTVHPACGRLKGSWSLRKECILFNSLFTLILQDSTRENEMMENMWLALKVGALPIIVDNPDLYRSWIPSRYAAIFLEDFSNYAEAAKYIHALSTNAKQWFQHLLWKKETLPANFLSAVHRSFATLPCDLCDKYGRDVLGWPIKTLPTIDVLQPCMLALLSAHRIPNVLPTIDSVFGFDAIFVVHYKPLKERKAVTRERVQLQLGVEPTFVEDFDREHLTAENLQCAADKQAQQAFIGRNTTIGEDSLSLKHMAVYFYMVEHALQNVLVLEDDATFVHPDWRSSDSIWQKIQRTLPPEYDILVLSGCCDIHNNGEQLTEHLYLAQQGRVSSMYLVSQKGARNMLRSLPLVAPIDYQMNYAVGWEDSWLQKVPDHRGPQTVDMQIYNSEPYLSEQVLPPKSSTRTVMQDT